MSPPKFLRRYKHFKLHKTVFFLKKYINIYKINKASSSENTEEINTASNSLNNKTLKYNSGVGGPEECRIEDKK